MKKLFFVSIALILYAPIIVYAEIRISEIMYDPPSIDTGHEWVEIYNDTDATVTLTDWKFFENATNHRIVEFRGGTSLPPHGYAVIADNPANFLADNSSYTGLLFDSAFSLNNTGETLSLIDDGGNTRDTVSYTVLDGANGTGYSLQYNSSTWVSASLTLGSAYQTLSTQNNDTTDTSSTDDDTQTSNDDNNSIDDTTNVTQNDTTIYQTSLVTDKKHTMSASSIMRDMKGYFDPYYTSKLTIPAHGVAGVAQYFALDITLHRYKEEDKLVNHGEYIWSMGDGTTYTDYWNTHHNHTYEYPGKYIVVVEFYDNGNILPNAEPTFHLEKQISIINSDIQLIGIDYQGSIHLENMTNGIFDFSDWRICYSIRCFVVPEYTYIPKKESRYFPTSVTGFNSIISDSSAEVALKYPDGRVHSSYVRRPQKDISVEIENEMLYTDDESTQVQMQDINDVSEDNINSIEDETQIELLSQELSDKFSASASDSIIKTKSEATIPKWLWVLFSASIIGAVGTLIYIYRLDIIKIIIRKKD